MRGSVAARGRVAPGERQRALLHFARAIKDAQLQGQWNDAASTPPALRPDVEQAVSAVRRGQRMLFDQLLVK